MEEWDNKEVVDDLVLGAVQNAPPRAVKTPPLGP